ncbi:hypothetical protein CYR55_14080 [Chimaeribacter californicus]|uniref:DUF2726 domain-containing protein n=1 Tax=Chimaeribacter californicus TaxID=2060067 RepID=A0A2N5E2U7_9GAMM|nr:DUF2726 domain-containing protein [Chimaeribacter californicus]PLR35029.1 hypothetical protein CYR55_14080 [Chimaeribacter californicus]
MDSVIIIIVILLLLGLLSNLLSLFNKGKGDNRYSENSSDRVNKKENNTAGFYKGYSSLGDKKREYQKNDIYNKNPARVFNHEKKTNTVVKNWDEKFWELAKGGGAFKRQKFLTEREAKFFNKLIINYGKEFSIHSQVSLGALVAPGERYAYGSDENKIIFSMVNKLRVDFVLYSRKEKEVAAVIELDDSTHSAPARIERDNKLDEVLKQAGIRVIRVINIEQELPII